MGRILGVQDVEAALRGGSIFAAGGGGWVEHGVCSAPLRSRSAVPSSFRSARRSARTCGTFGWAARSLRQLGCTRLAGLAREAADSTFVMI